MSDKTFRRWEPDQQILFPPSIKDFVPKGHLAHFIRVVVRNDRDLSAIFAHYTERRGQPPYHPALMTSLLLYAYSRGIYSSRRIERACEERVDFMALTGGEKPDHSTICLFRSDHREALSALFVQVLALCRDAGMVKLGHVALDGTKMKAKQEAVRVAKRREEREKELGHKLGGKEPRALSGEPEDKAQSNFTDPESRIMKTKDGYEQAYNCQAGVEAGSQVIVCHGVTAKQNDHDELVPMVDQIEENTGDSAKEVSADKAYCSEGNIEALEERLIRGYLATGRQKHGAPSPTEDEEERGGPKTRAMRSRLRRGGWRSRYRLRKFTVEPVFGQIKEDRGFRQFLRRGLENVAGEWALLCTVHNLLKLAAVRSG